MGRLKLRTYGHNGTIHGTNYVDVETNAKGQVVGVWFRCQTLPFVQTGVDSRRAKELLSVYRENKMPKIHAVVLED
jgi:hypothetical protein